jgi:site-specific DNA-methyltransferase (adenine-specific)
MYKQKETIGNATLYLADARDLLPNLKNFDCIFYDPPFDIWGDFNVVKADQIVAFCSPTSRHTVENILGKPRSEIVWHFADGRWVSRNLPRITHDYIYIYGETSSANVGDYQKTKGQSKGNTSIGKDVLGKRFYKPKQRKQLNSVQIFPRNMNNPLGSWGKPISLVKRLIEWIAPNNLLDPFMGSGTTIDACMQLGIEATGIEINQDYFDITCHRLDKLATQPNLFTYQSFNQTQLL